MEHNVIFQYNNVSKPYLLVKVFSEGKMVSKGAIEFEQSSLERGLPNYTYIYNKVDEFLKLKNANRSNALILLNCSQAFKLCTSVPNINNKKTRKLYEMELVKKIPNYSDYSVVSTNCNVGNNKIFYEYLLEKRYGDFFVKLSESLGFTSNKIDFYYSYLFEKTKNLIESNTYAYFYEEKDVVSLLLSINGVLSAYSSFGNNIKNIRLNISSIIDKHIYEIEKAELNIVAVNKEMSELNGIKYTVKEYEIGNE